MFVSDSVFERMQAAAERATIGGFSFNVVSLFHLIALKCHAIQHSKSLRRLKDFEDLIQLISINGLDLNQAELQAIVLKHGNQELLEKLRHACGPEP